MFIIMVNMDCALYMYLLHIKLKSSTWMSPHRSSLDLDWVVKSSIQYLYQNRRGILPSGQWIYDHYNGSIALVWVGMTLYNSQDTFPCYDLGERSTLFWYLPQVTTLTISDPPCIDYQVLWQHLKSPNSMVNTAEDLLWHSNYDFTHLLAHSFDQWSHILRNSPFETP